MPPIVQVQVSRSPGDCAVVALSMYLGKPYEDVFAAAVSVTKNIVFHKMGMFYPQIHQVGQIFGAALHTRKTFNLETACGIIGLKRKHGETRKLFEQHVAFLKAGLIFDGDGTVWDAETYLAHNGYISLCLTTSEEEDEK